MLIDMWKTGAGGTLRRNTTAIDLFLPITQFTGPNKTSTPAMLLITMKNFTYAAQESMYPDSATTAISPENIFPVGSDLHGIPFLVLSLTTGNVIGENF